MVMMGYPLTEAGIAQAWRDLDRQPPPASVVVVSTRRARVMLGMPGVVIHRARREAVEWPDGSSNYVVVWE